MSWSDCTLGDVVTLKRGHDLPQARRKEGSIPVVSSSGITGFHNEARADAPGVVTGRYGTLGEVFFLEQPYWPLNTSLYAIDFKGNEPRFVAYFLKNALKSYQSDKAAVPGVDRNVLHKLPARCPDPQHQQRITTILKSYDDLIENNRRRIALLEEAARLLYREWFVHFRFPGHEHMKIDDGVPEGWKDCAASEAISVNPKTTWSGDGVIRMVPMAALSENGMTVDRSTIEERQKATSIRFINGDTLLARITPCLENGKTGYVSCLDQAEVACGSTEFIILRENLVSRYFIYLLAREESFRGNAIASMIGSSGRQRVQTSSFDKYRIPVPPKSIAETFDDTVRPMFEQIGILEKQNQSLRVAYNLLLPRLMDGRIEV